MRAVSKSAIVTAWCGGSVLLALAINEVSVARPLTGLIVAALFSAAGWWFGLIIVKHPLLLHVRSAAKGVNVFARRMSALRQENPLRSDENLL